MSPRCPTLLTVVYDSATITHKKGSRSANERLSLRSVASKPDIACIYSRTESGSSFRGQRAMAPVKLLNLSDHISALAAEEFLAMCRLATVHGGLSSVFWLSPSRTRPVPLTQRNCTVQAEFGSAAHRLRGLREEQTDSGTDQMPPQSCYSALNPRFYISFFYSDRHRRYQISCGNVTLQTPY